MLSVQVLNMEMYDEFKMKLQKFRDGKTRVLCTYLDLVHNLDFPEAETVINYDMEIGTENYKKLV